MRFPNFISFPRLRILAVFLLSALLTLTASMLRAGENESTGILPTTNGPASPVLIPTTTTANPIKVSMSSIPFDTIQPDGFIVREVIVQNDSPKPANVAIRMRFTERYYAQTYSRMVTTSRQIPANSRQTIPLFVPTGLFGHRFGYRDSAYFNSADPRIYVNGREYRPLPTGFMEGQTTERRFLPLPSSFSGEEELAEILALAITGQPNYETSLLAKQIKTPILLNEERINPVISGSDTIQWPSIPQFYQSQRFIFRKTTDQFTPDAERAIHDAVMLGATEILFVMPGSPWPEWAPRPAGPGRLSIVARGFGQSVVLDASAVRSAPTGFSGSAFRPPVPDNEDEKFWMENDASERERKKQLINNNLTLTTELQNAAVLAFNPAPVFLALPHVAIPSIPFILVIFALLVYIIVVGPVNYFRLIRKKKSVLLLLLTVPLISIAFVVVVIFFVGIVEGWSSSASAVGVTFLDQRENMAYTRASVNLYAPVPVRTLVFDPADSVLFSSTKDVNIMFGRDQLISGANRARVPLAYSISRAEKHLEQLKVVRDASGVSVVNGLGALLNKLIVKTEDGQIWTASGAVAPGESARLDKFDGKLMAKEEIDNMLARTLKGEHSISGDIRFPFNGLLLTASGLLLEMPADLPLEKRNALLPSSTYGTELNMLVKYDIFAAKACLEKPGFLESVLPAGMYMAETDKPLFYSPGCKPVSFRARHIVFGSFAAQEATNEN